MSRQVTIDVEARFVDHITGNSKSASDSIEKIGKSADKAQKQVDVLSKKHAKPAFDADDSRFIRKIRNMEAKMRNMGRSKTATVLHAVDKASTVIAKVLYSAKNFGSKVWRGILDFDNSRALSGIRSVTRGAENLTKKTWTALVKVKDMALAPIRAIKNALFSIPTLITAVVSAKVVQKGVIEPIQLADQYTSAKIGFTTLLGEKRATKMMNEIDAFAAATPFKTSNVISNIQKMMAYGWDVERVIDDMKVIGDAAAATGKGDQGLESIVYALSEIRSKGKLSTQELNQLASAGIKAKAYLAEGLGYGTSDEGFKKLAEDLEDGVIGANQAVDLILQGMTEFDGMMDKTANTTVKGLKDQLLDLFEINVSRRWGQGLQEGVIRGLGTVTSLVDEAGGAFEALGKTVQELGSTIGNWFADKLEVAVGKVQEITDSWEYQNAGFGGKISMLWNGLIVDPLQEWWENGGQEKTAKTAGKIGRWIGETLTKGLLAIFGATDILKDIDGADAGSSVAGSFLQGFMQTFDFEAITDGFVKAVKNVWNALPTWGKFLVGGYAFGKTASGVGRFVGGIGNLFNAFGSAGGGIKGFIGSAGGFSAAGAGYAYTKGTGVLGKLASLGYFVSGGKAKNMGMSGTKAATVGTGTATAVVGLISAGSDFYNMYKAYKKGDTKTADIYLTKGSVMVGAIGAGAGIGAAIGGLPGAAIGAGIGAIGGWLFGDYYMAKQQEKAEKLAEEERRKFAKENYHSRIVRNAIINEASDEEFQKALEQAKYEIAKEAFGNISLTTAEIKSIADQIVWGDDLEYFEGYTAAVQEAENSLQSLKNSIQSTDKWMWKAGLNVTFDEDEKEAFLLSFDEYITSAKNLLENKHYEFTSSASMLLDVESEIGQSILDLGNTYFSQESAELSELSTNLSQALTDALEDSVVGIDEAAIISEYQTKIADIMAKFADAEADAEMELLKHKYGAGALDKESYDNLSAALAEASAKKSDALDDAYLSMLTQLNLQYPNGGDAYKDAVEEILKGWEEKAGEIKASVTDVEVEILGDAFSGHLGVNAKDKLNNALEKALEGNIDPIEWSASELSYMLGLTNDLKEDAAAVISEYLSKTYNDVSKIKEGPPSHQGDDKQLEKALHNANNPDTFARTDETADAFFNKLRERYTEIDPSYGDWVDYSGLARLSEKLRGPGTGRTDAPFDDTQELIDSIVEAFEKDYEIEVPAVAQIIWELSGATTLETKLKYLEQELGFDEERAKTILWRVSAEATIENRVDVLAEECGISETEAAHVLWYITGDKEILTKFDITPEDFNIEALYEQAPEVDVAPKEDIDKLNISGEDLVEFDNMTVSPTIYVDPKYQFSTSSYTWHSSTSSYTSDPKWGSSISSYTSSLLDKYLRKKARGGIVGYSDGGMVRGGSQLIEVAEEGSPEMIIPLSSQRRGRALKLWAQAGNIMGVPGFARGGMTYGGSDEGIRFQTYSNDSSSGAGQAVQIDVGGLTFEINVNGGDATTITEAIKAQAAEIADVVAGVLADSLEAQFENTPLRGGAR